MGREALEESPLCQRGTGLLPLSRQAHTGRRVYFSKSGRNCLQLLSTLKARLGPALCLAGGVRSVAVDSRSANFSRGACSRGTEPKRSKPVCARSSFRTGFGPFSGVDPPLDQRWAMLASKRGLRWGLRHAAGPARDTHLSRAPSGKVFLLVEL
ncbi:hypothetical protein AAFF_G00130170 [Aldrovandia affinis]|uniref:Uncharacterized protein n=1 Tax=Aldrovandia affinis TaxID=143900 RepID=A0AAD7WAE8_9TELE|nr:hypothetical protein AAFF_G00130170 [Aldrovandia affinis]